MLTNVLGNKRQDSKVFVHYDYTIFKKESKILTIYTKYIQLKETTVGAVLKWWTSGLFLFLTNCSSATLLLSLWK